MESKDWWGLAQILLVIFIIFTTYSVINQFLASILTPDLSTEAPDMNSFLISISIIALFLISLILYRLKHKAGFYLSLFLSAIFGFVFFVIFVISAFLTGYMNAMLGNPEHLIVLRNYAILVSILVIAGFSLLFYSTWKSKTIFYPID